MDIEYTVLGIATVPDGVDINDVVISPAVSYPDGNGELVTVDKWENEVLEVEKSVMSSEK